MKIKTLASSSAGNAHIVESEGCRIMLDCGLTRKQLHGKGVKLSELSGCLITHCHQDHAKGVRDLIRSGCDVYLLKDTSRVLDLPRSHRRRIIKPLTRFKVGAFSVSTFSGHHDVEVLGFQIEAGGEKLIYITDSCYCEYKFGGVTHLFLECNYDPASLEMSGNSKETVRRVIQTHLGLENVIKILEDNDLSKLKEVRLCHLSDANSNEEFILKMVKKALPEGIKIEVAKK